MTVSPGADLGADEEEELLFEMGISDEENEDEMRVIPSQTMSIPVLHCKLVGGLVTKSDAYSADLTNHTTGLVFLFLRSGGIWKRDCGAQRLVRTVLPFEGAIRKYIKNRKG